MDNRTKKSEIKDSILQILKHNGSGKMPVMIASYCLETGFKNSTIEQIFIDLISVGLINIKGDIVTLGKTTDTMES